MEEGWGRGGENKEEPAATLPSTNADGYFKVLNCLFIDDLIDLLCF